MEQKKDIQDLMWEGIQHLSQKSHSVTTIYHYAWVWRKFVVYAREKGVDSYSTQLNDEFRKLFLNQYSGDNKKWVINITRVLKVLDEIFHGRDIRPKYTASVYIPEHFLTEYNTYKSYLLQKGQKPRTIETKLSRSLVFLRYLEKRELSSEDIDGSVLEMFFKYLTLHYTLNAQANIKFTLRDFLQCLEKENKLSIVVSAQIGVIYSDKHGRLPSTYTIDEINRILIAVDRTTPSGKRDYAMLGFLVQLGLRTSDICHLKIDSVHLESHSLVFRQQKTGTLENLPLTESIVLSLADYLKNARPRCDSDYLFVKIEGAYKGMPYGTSALYYSLNKYMKKAGIEITGKRHGTHSIRHSLAANLFKAETPLPVISSILGHNSSEITTRYLWMDTEQLRKLALEVPYEK
jgi:site-specific recombinase XerD